MFCHLNPSKMKKNAIFSKRMTVYRDYKYSKYTDQAK